MNSDGYKIQVSSLPEAKLSPSSWPLQCPGIWEESEQPLTSLQECLEFIARKAHQPRELKL